MADKPDFSHACSIPCAAESLPAAPALGQHRLAARTARPYTCARHPIIRITGDPMSNSYFPHWKLADDTVPGAIIAPDERLSWPKNVAMGPQHVVAMFGPTGLAALIMGFRPHVAILLAGPGN